MMKTARLKIRPLAVADRASFIRGIQDRELCKLYGFPEKMNDGIAEQIFEHFLGLQNAFALTCADSGSMIGFVLDLQTELPQETKAALPPKGRTFAYATFPPFQRQGYMLEALRALIDEAFQNREIDYIHCGRFEYNEPSEMLLRKLGFSEFQRHRYRDKTIVDEILKRSGRKERTSTRWKTNADTIP